MLRSGGNGKEFMADIWRGMFTSSGKCSIMNAARWWDDVFSF